MADSSIRSTDSTPAKPKSPLLVIAAIFLAPILVFEGIFGRWIGPAYYIPVHVLRNVHLRQDVREIYDRPGGSVIDYKRDIYGLRGRYDDLSRIDILTMGGSTTDQRLIHEGETWQDVLSDEFKAHGRTVSVVNAGRDGMSTVGQLWSFDHWFSNVPNLKPRYILFYVGPLDLRVRNWKAELSAPPDPSPAPVRILRQRSGLVALYKRVRERLEDLSKEQGPVIVHGQDNEARAQWTSAPLQRDYERWFAEDVAGFGERLRLLSERARRLGAEPIFVTHPFNSFKLGPGGKVLGMALPEEFHGAKFNGVDMFHILGLMNRRNLEVCREVNAICIDLASELVLDERDFYDQGHNTPSGTRKIGRYLYRKLASVIR